MRFGMDFGGTNVKLGVFSEAGKAVAFEELPLKELCRGGDLFTNLVQAAREFTRGYSLEKGGLGIKGLVNTRSGFMEDDIGAGALLAGRNLPRVFGDALAIPFAVDNDARAYAWGEWKFGAGKQTAVMVCLTLGTGLGCSLVVNNRPYEGSDPLGGILGGHISIDRHGPLCPCGNRGCLELYCSATAFAKRIEAAHAELTREATVLKAFFAAIRNGRKEYLPTLKAFQEDLAIGIVNVIHAYGPEMVVLGGGLMNSNDVILPELIPLVQQMAWTMPRGKVAIRAAELGNKAAALGAAFHPVLDD